MFSLIDNNTKIFSHQDFCLLRLRDSESYPGLFLGHHVVKSLRRLLLIMEYVSVFVFVLSFRYHRVQALEAVNLNTTEEYFINFIGESSKNNHSINSYHSYRYFFIHSGGSFIARGVMAFHRMLEGVSILFDNLPPKSLPHYRYCNIREFPVVLKSANTIAIPDSNYSMVILSISTFFWMVYIALLAEIFLLEKKLAKAIAIQKALEKLIISPQSLPLTDLIQFLSKMSDKSCSQDRLEDMLPRDLLKEIQAPTPQSSLLISSVCVVIFLITIFGVYAFKNAKMGIDSYLVSVWEGMKISLLSLFGFLCGQFYKL